MYDEESYDWAREQMKRLNVPKNHAALIERLLEVYWANPVSKELDPGTTEDMFKVFTELAQHHVLVGEAPEGTWVQAKPGALVIRDVVRVRADAYTGPAGIAHNGRVGQIVAIRSGDIHVKYDDEPDVSKIVRHSPFALEKRVL